MDKYYYELHYLQVILPQLENYLLGTDLYRMIFIPAQRGEPSYPSLSLGAFLLSLKKAHGYSKFRANQTELTKIDAEVITLRQHWRQAWENKALREMQNRANLWQSYLSELIANPNEQMDRFTYEVRQRVIMELLRQEIVSPNESVMANLDLLDQILRSSFQTGEFVWDTELKAEFPSPAYWFLWGKPYF